MAAQKRGWQWKPYTNGFQDVESLEQMPVGSERDVFEIVGLAYHEPKFR